MPTLKEIKRKARLDKEIIEERLNKLIEDMEEMIDSGDKYYNLQSNVSNLESARDSVLEYLDDVIESSDVSEEEPNESEGMFPL